MRTRNPRWRAVLAAVVVVVVAGAGTAVWKALPDSPSRHEDAAPGAAAATGTPTVPPPASPTTSPGGNAPGPGIPGKHDGALRAWSALGKLRAGTLGSLLTSEVSFTAPGSERKVVRSLVYSERIGRIYELRCFVDGARYDELVIRELSACVRSVLEPADADAGLAWLTQHARGNPVPGKLYPSTFGKFRFLTRIDDDRTIRLHIRPPNEQERPGPSAG